MEARTGLVIGGLAAVTASVAVVTAVAFANTMALADSPGATVAAGRVMVPAAAADTILDESPTATDEPETTSPGPEVVEAPDPVVVAPPSNVSAETTRDQAADATTATGDASTPAEPEKNLDELIAAAKASGSWDAIRSWAAAHGWSGGRRAVLIARLENERAAEKAAQDERQSADSDRASLGGTESQGDFVAIQPEKKKQQTGPTTGTERPAPAGSNVGHGHGAGHDGKKDQSRDSPDRRD